MAEVLSVPIQPESQSYFSSSPLRRSSPSQTFLGGSSSSHSLNRTSKYSHKQHAEHIPASQSPSAPSSTRPSFANLPKAASFSSESTSSISLDEEQQNKNEEIAFPSYQDNGFHAPNHEDLEPPASPKTENSYTVPSSSSASTTTTTLDHLPVSEDDTSIRREPSRHVDYLSHDWREDEIWSSWRLIVSKRRTYGQRSRLENASWRTWAKTKHKLRTVPPETLNWLKESDVTWLYGPLQTPSNPFFSNHATEPPSHLSKNNSFINKKPILKKRSMSEVMLHKSLSASSLVKQAAAAVQAQQGSCTPRGSDRPIMGRFASDFVTSAMPSKPGSGEGTDYFSSRSSSGLVTPDQGEKKHIRFDDKVEQCIAVDVKEGGYDEDEDEPWMNGNDSSDDDGVVMMKKSKRKRPSLLKPARHSSNAESKTIAKLPSTTLKYRTDSPDISEQPPASGSGFWRSSKLSPSSSQETLKPSHPSKNFLLAEEDEDEDISWEPSGAFSGRRDSVPYHRERATTSPQEESSHGIAGLRRTPSGMFMPYEEDEDDVVAAGLFGKVVDTVNTAKDIAHVIWNVGWRR